MTKAYRHEKYGMFSYGNDIGVLCLDEPLRLGDSGITSVQLNRNSSIPAAGDAVSIRTIMSTEKKILLFGHVYVEFAGRSVWLGSKF